MKNAEKNELASSTEKTSRRSFLGNLGKAGITVALWKIVVLPMLTAFVLSMTVSVWAQSRNADELWGTRYSNANQIRTIPRRPPPNGENAMARLTHWNEIAVNASGLDHTPVLPGDPRVFGEQLGPGRAARAMAIVHIAIFDAIATISGSYRTYTGLTPTRQPKASMDAAIAQAAYETLIAMFPSQAASLQQMLVDDLNQIPNGRAKQDGIDLGHRTAAAILAMRAADGSQHPEPRLGIDYFPSSMPGLWRQDPISLIPLALGAHWGEVAPFVMQSASQFRIPPPPAMTSAAYTAAFNEVKQFGGDGIITPTVRTADQTEMGIYWAYDGTPSLCAPPRLYNQIVMHIAGLKGSNVVQTARLLALVNTAMADAGTASWESKYYYNVWRPIGGIREADIGTGPTGMGDGNPATIGDPNFFPLGAPASNLTGPNFTPPFPAYPSGHATFGGTIFQMLRNFYGTDNIPFTFISDELNGTTIDNQGNTRPLKPRSFATLSQAEEENGQSRIYLGIHWSFDKTEGIAQGRRVADYVFRNAFTPRGN